VELADIVRAHGAAYQRAHPLCHAQRRALRAIATCRFHDAGLRKRQKASAGFNPSIWSATWRYVSNP